MKQVVAFGASSSKKSINKNLATWAASTVSDAEVTILDLNDFEMPIYSIDRQENGGIPQAAKDFKKYIVQADGIIISFSEHNGTYTAAFKNILDWVSRLEGMLWEERPMLLLSTSPGGNGAATVLASAVAAFPYLKGKVVGSLAIPFYGKNFTVEDGITDQKLAGELQALIKLFSEHL